MARMRVIAGKARGRKLRMAPGDIARPIMDRVKEALFNILGTEVAESAFLDLFAGTGSVGIEALSRGAKYVRFVDRNRLAVRTIQENLAETGLEEGAEVLNEDAFKLLGRGANWAFDYVYIAPPQYEGMWKRALLALDAAPGWLVEDGWVIAQIDPLEYEALTLKHLDEFDRRKYGNTELVFYERREEPSPPAPLP